MQMISNSIQQDKQFIHIDDGQKMYVVKNKPACFSCLIFKNAEHLNHVLIMVE